MTPDACRDWRGVLGAVALGRAEPAERAALDAHLEGCAACVAELAELRTVARALPLADVERALDAPADPPGSLAAEVVARVGAARTSRRRRRATRAALALAAAVVVALGVAALVVDGERARAQAVVALDGPRADGEASLRDLAHGTEVRLVATGLDQSEWYWLWVTGEDGRRVGAGTFRGTPGTLRVTTTAGLMFGETRRVWVTDADDAVVLDGRVE